MNLQENTLFDIWSWPKVWVKVTRNVAQYPLQHAIDAATKFNVATANCLGGYTNTRNRRHAWTDGWLTDFGSKLMYHFSKEKSGYMPTSGDLITLKWKSTNWNKMECTQKPRSPIAIVSYPFTLHILFAKKKDNK